MNFLRLSSILLLALYSCVPYSDLPGSYSDTKCLNLLDPSEETLLYKTQIDFYKKHFSGLLMLKSIEGKRRAVFTNEMGITFFDLEFVKNGDFKVIKIVPGLDRKTVINILKQNISMMMSYSINDSCRCFLEGTSFKVMREKTGQNRFNCYIASPDCSSLIKIEHYKRSRKKAEAAFSNSDGMDADSVVIHHTGLKLSMHFTKIIR